MRTFRILRPHTALLGLRCHNVLLRRNLLPSSPLSISTCRQKNPQFTRHFCSVYPFKYQSSHSFKYQSSHSFKCQSSHSFKCQSSHSFRYYSSQESSAVNPDQSGDERDSSSLGSNPSFDQVPRARLAAAKWSDKEVDGEGKSGANSLNYGVPRRGDLGSVLLNNSKKKAKSKILWVCSNCGNSYGQWWGTCTSCNHVGTITQFSLGDSAVASHVSSGDFVTENKVGTWLPEQSLQNRPVRLRDVSRSINQMQWRIPLAGLFGAEVSRVLGGGVVPGSLILVGGDPGVGKSTLSLLIASIIAEANGASEQNSVLYVSGEESVEQIGNRADRMRIDTEHLFLYSSTDIEDILKKSQGVSARALIVDSIQTVYLKGVTGSPGGIQQVKECTSALLRFAKATNIPVLLIGHVNKSGEIAGPRVLEHIVDVVLYMEGEKHSSHRLLRSVKNRFGSTDELGVFEMSQSGLQAVANPSKIFLTEQYSDSEHLAGLAVAAIVDGSRTFLIEVQALCISGSNGGRHFNGVPTSRADMIISVLMKQAGLKLEGNAVFLNVVSGVSLTETAGDLAVAAAICSSYLEFPVPNNVSFIGEIGLGGELRMVPRIEKRVNTVAKLGYKACIVPKSAEASLNSLGFADIEIIGCKNVKEVINKVFCTKK